MGFYPAAYRSNWYVIVIDCWKRRGETRSAGSIAQIAISQLRLTQLTERFVVRQQNILIEPLPILDRKQHLVQLPERAQVIRVDG